MSYHASACGIVSSHWQLGGDGTAGDATGFFTTDHGANDGRAHDFRPTATATATTTATEAIELNL